MIPWGDPKIFAIDAKPCCIAVPISEAEVGALAIAVPVSEYGLSMAK
jgi:hypothetical protein